MERISVQKRVVIVQHYTILYLQVQKYSTYDILCLSYCNLFESIRMHIRKDNATYTSNTMDNLKQDVAENGLTEQKFYLRVRR